MVRAIETVSSRDSNGFAGHALWLLLLTGIRRNEILEAKWADVDWEKTTTGYAYFHTEDLPKVSDRNGRKIVKIARVSNTRNDPRAIAELRENCRAFVGSPLIHAEINMRMKTRAMALCSPKSSSKVTPLSDDPSLLSWLTSL